MSRALAILACTLALAACGGGDMPPDTAVDPPRCERGECR